MQSYKVVPQAGRDKNKTHFGLAQQFRVLAALAEDWTLVPHAHVRQLATETPGDRMSPSGFLDTHRHTDTYMIKIK